MKIQELRGKSQVELQKLLTKKRKRLRQLSFDLASGKIKNIREIRETKKDIARILTIEADKRGTKRGKTRKNPRKSACISV